MDAAGGVLRPYVAFLDSGGNSIYGAYDYSDSQGGSAVFTISINPGAVYYIRAGRYDSLALGSYTITLTTLEDDHGSTPATATSLALSGSGTWSSAGSIQYSNDNDWFRWTAPADAAGIQVKDPQSLFAKSTHVAIANFLASKTRQQLDKLAAEKDIPLMTLPKAS